MIPLIDSSTGRTVLEPPEKDWGVEKEKISTTEIRVESAVTKLLIAIFAGFFGSIGLTIVNLIFSLEMDNDMLTNIMSNTLALGLILFMIFGAVFENRQNARDRPVRDLSNERREEWEKNILAPYIAEEYGVKLLQVFPHMNEALVSKDGEEFRVKFNGLVYNRHNEFGHTVSRIPSYTASLSQKGLTLDRHMVLPLERNK